jgi:hypothetical protein
VLVTDFGKTFQIVCDKGNFSLVDLGCRGPQMKQMPFCEFFLTIFQ